MKMSRVESPLPLVLKCQKLAQDVATKLKHVETQGSLPSNLRIYWSLRKVCQKKKRTTTPYIASKMVKHLPFAICGWCTVWTIWKVLLLTMIKSQTINKVSFLSFHQEAQWQRARLNDPFPQQQVSCNFSLVQLAQRTPPPRKSGLVMGLLTIGFLLKRP